MSEQYEFDIVPADSIKSEDGAAELMSAPEMQPYLRFAEAAMLGEDVAPALREIAQLPLDKRYIWRIASALKQGFADFDGWSVVADRRTLKKEDMDTIVDLLQSRPIQFCLFVKALCGPEGMEAIMTEAIAAAKK